MSFLLMTATLDLNAQSTKFAKKKYPHFLELKSMADTSLDFYDTTVNLGMDIINAEFDNKEKGYDTLFVANVSSDIAGIFQKQYKYSLASIYYKLAAAYYRLKGKETESGNAVGFYLYNMVFLEDWKLSFPEWTETDSTLFARGKKDSAWWVTARASSITKSENGDTLFITIESGRAQGLRENSKFDVFTTFDTFYNVDRTSVKAGTGFLTEISDYTSKGYIVLFDEFKDTIYKDDAFEVIAELDKDLLESDIAQIAAYNIKFYNHRGDRYYVAGDASLTLSTSRFDKIIKQAILHDFEDAIVYYNEVDSTIMQTEITSGPFNGMTYEQCLRNTTMFDLEVFLDYVNTYPRRYLNRQFNFLDRYITWAINDGYTGNNEIRVMDSIILMDKERLLKNSTRWGAYYKQIVNNDSLAQDRISKLYEENYVAQLEASDKFKALAKKEGLIKTDSFFSVQYIFQLYNNGKHKDIIKSALEVWPILKARQKMLIALYLGISYSHENQNEMAIQYLDSAIAIDTGYIYARGYKGWNLTKLGRVKAAYPHCLYAFETDSFVTWSNINLAHVLILKGMKDEANRLYKKSFEMMTVPSQYATGLEADFNYFIESGLNEQEFRELKKYYRQYFTDKWEKQLTADSLKTKAIALKDKEDYNSALRLMQAATAQLESTPEKEMDKIHANYRWVAYLNYKLRDYKTSLKYYKYSAELTQNFGLGEDNLITDYSDISNIYDWLNDTLHQMEYRARSSALEVSLREKRDAKKMFMLLIGPDGLGMNDTFAASDTRMLGEKLKHSADLHYDMVSDFTITGKHASLENVKKALDSAIYSLGENDVFVFYFSGFARNTYDEGIQLNDGIFKINDLYGYLGQIAAGRQIHIADCNGLNWREWYQRGNISLLANEKRSLVFMGLKNARIEDNKAGHSVLTKSLLTAFDFAAEDGKITATEWVSKAASYMFENNELYAIEMQSYGHDFVVGEQKIALRQLDTFSPQIELFGATMTRGENISLVSTKGVNSGRITDDSKVVFAQANNYNLVLSSNGRFELPKELIGVKNIRITAVDEFGNKSQRDFIVTQTENTSSNEGIRYAYLFASTEYQYWGKLQNPIFDATSISQLLEKNYGYQVKVIPNPSRWEIAEKLDFIRRFNFKSNDQLMVFFAGHGLYDSVWGGYYVCPESKMPKDDKYYETYYPQQRIADLLDGCKAKNVFLVMDVCFGGKMFDKHDRHEYRSVQDGNEISADEYIKRQLDIPCRQFLTSGGNNYVADGVAGSHSPFASRFIAALEDGATNKEYITASEVMDYLWTMKTVGNDKKSLPRYGFFGGDKDGEYVLKVTKKIINSAVIAGL